MLNRNIDLSWASDSTILVTGGTGSFGKEFARATLARSSVKKLIIFSRDEMKQWEMAKSFAGDDRIRFFVGDVRDPDRLDLACREVDYIVHAAALKIIPTAEYNPFECIRTNIEGARNVILSSLKNNVKKVIALSTDKACNPVNLYGATKLCSDKLFVAGNSYSGSQPTSFAVVRYGNVMGSRGSVIPFFLKQAVTGTLPVTDERMTRFMLTLPQAVELVWYAMQDSLGGEIYVPKIPSMKVVDIARAVAPHAELKFIGMRPGEKLHEEMISEVDARTTVEYSDHYKILPEILARRARSNDGVKCQSDFRYASNTNTLWMSIAELRTWIQNSYLEKDSAKDENPSSDSEPEQTLILELDDLLDGEEVSSRSEVASIVRLYRECKFNKVLSEIDRIEGDKGEAGPRDKLRLQVIKALSRSQLGQQEEAIRILAAHLSKEPASRLAGKLLLSLIHEKER